LGSVESSYPINARKTLGGRAGVELAPLIEYNAVVRCIVVSLALEGENVARLSVRLLGPLQVTLDGEPVTAFESDKVRALLAYLVTEAGSQHRRERLAGLLWPERPESMARNNLRVALANLRRAIGDHQATPPFLTITRQTLQFNLESDAWSDVAAFAALLKPQSTAKQTVQYLEEAIRLYRGDFVEGFSLPGSAALEEWVLLTRERLGRQVQATLQRLTRYHQGRGAYERALRYARYQAALAPWEEQGQRCVMRLLALTGQRNAALVQYESLRQILAEELGVEPEDETTALYQRIRDRADLSALLLGPVHNLPAPLTPFVGREAELAAIIDRLRDPACRLLTLIGPGGCGKTRLAIEATMNILLEAHLDSYRDGIFFVPLVSIQSAAAIVPTVVKALGFTFDEEESELGQQLIEYLRHKNMLLILDNFEHLLACPSDSEHDRKEPVPKDSVELVIDILRTAPGLRILATSCVRLNVPGEYLFPVAGMDVPTLETRVSSVPALSSKQPMGKPPDVTQSSAVRLFLQSARRIEPSFALTTDNLTDIVRICQLVQGMPLGILLATAWIRMLTPAEIAAQIGQSLDFLATDLHDVPARQRSMRAVFDHSWGLLTDRERVIFQTLSVFRGGFTRQAFQQVTGASLRQLKSLVDRSLLYPSPAPSAPLRTAGRYEVHELLRKFAAERLQTLGNADAARDAHSAYYINFLHQRQADLKSHRQLEAKKEIETDFENVRAAWTWTVQKQDLAAIKNALESLSLFWMYQSRDGGSKELLRQAREQLAPRSKDEPHVAWGWILVEEFYRFPHEIDQAQLERALAIMRQHGDQAGIARCLRALGELASNVGNRADALLFYEKSLTHYQKLDDGFNKAAILHKLAQEYRLLGQPEEAIKCARQSLGLSRKTGAKFWEASSLTNTGTIAFFTGNYTEARGYFREAKALYDEIEYRIGVASNGVFLAKLAFLRRDLERCRVLTREALEIATDLGNERIAQSALSLEELVASTLEEGTDRHPKKQKGIPIADMPSKVGQYELKRLLASGGMGTVYLAHDPNNGREVVLKVLVQKSAKEYETFRQLFKREAQVMGELTHPAIPRCYGFGETADHSYVVMEFIEGQSLDTILEEQEGFLPEKKAIEWTIQLCDVLIYLHSQKPKPLILRDIKPGNTQIDRHGRAYVVDFGITEAHPAGREQVPLGTEGYSPPEQYFGYSDARSDIYALGATLHQLLTGRDPRNAAPFSFHTAPPRSLNPSISEELETIVLRAVAHDPENRYQRVEEIKTALLGIMVSRSAAVPGSG
jgi:predicted ATPase/DNA-binding SARP family transcriptional activator/tRNA A-37 threonylcarbamoyl transferase component Bud32